VAREKFVLAIDQGTTSTRAILFDRDGSPRHVAQTEFPQIFPRSGWVEHDPERIWADTVAVCREVLAKAGVDAGAIDSIGITNQRETTVLWDRSTGKPVHNAIVWQDRRGAPMCDQLIKAGEAETIRGKTGLVVDSYFSATKLAWLLENVDGARAAAEKGDLAFGTIDSFLLWRLTGGKVHATDAANASRTMLFNIHTQTWDEDLLKLFDVPPELLPQVLDSSTLYGHTQSELFGTAIAVTGMAGDQQAATFGQACFEPGMIKSTYGTGCFVLLNTGSQALTSENQLLTTVAWRLGGQTTYALEGSIFVAGAAVQWLRDGIGVISHAGETEPLAAGADGNGGVYLVPAFTGLGAPHWDADARGAIVGLTRDTGIAEIVRAALEAVCYQTRDLMDAMAADGADPTVLRVDGGMVANDWIMQFLADTLGLPVERPVTVETTALGAAYLAGLHTGFYGALDDISRNWQRDRVFNPNMAAERRDALYLGWQDAVQRVKTR
jgi:glycerol kinase